MDKSAAEIILKGSNAFVTGALTFATVPQLRITGDKAIVQNRTLSFDFSGIKQCDSSALALLTAWTRLSRAQGKAIAFINLPRQLRDLARISDLEPILPIEDRELSWTN